MSVDITSAPFQVPVSAVSPLSPMYQPVKGVDIGALTTGVIGGTGAFDLIMAAVSAQLLGEFNSGRITGGEYTKAYIETMQAALQTALQFALGADQSFWQAQNAQIAAVSGMVALETARYGYSTTLPLQTAALTLQNTGLTTQNSIGAYNLANTLPEQLALLTAQVAQTTAQTAIEGYNLANTLPAQLTLLQDQAAGQVILNSTASYNLASILPANLTLLTEQAAGLTIQNSTATFNLSSTLPAQLTLLTEQATGLNTQNAISAYNLASTLPAQLAILAEQLVLVTQQAEVQHAQVSDTLLNGSTAIMGVMGSQEALYKQQITSYQRDAEVKAATLFSNTWITQKTLDSGLLAPNCFDNDTTNQIMQVIMTANGFGTAIP